MTFGAGSYGLGFLAGVLSTLSPCVLPLAPILLSSAASTHRRAPVALAVGVALSYAVIGTTLAWAGSTLNIDESLFHKFAAVVLGALGIVLIWGSAQQRFAAVTSGLSNGASSLLNRIRPDGLQGQFFLGLVLGLVWAPCVGPTLGAAIVVASQGEQLPKAALLMGVFGLGAALPLLVMAQVSQHTLGYLRGRLIWVGRNGKIALGATMLGIAILTISGIDKSLEAWLVEYSPEWLTTLTTRF